MGMVIKSVATSQCPQIQGSTAHAAEAGRQCLLRAALPPSEVDLLLNVGIYRDSNLVEPALAAIVQKELGINLDLIKYPTHKPTVSFDLMNGACGILNAVQVAGAFLATKSAHYALLIASDAHPAHHLGQATPAEFPYLATGGAMLLEWSEDQNLGFGPIQIKNSKHRYEAHFLGQEGFLEIHPPHVRSEGRKNLTLRTHPQFNSRLLEFLGESISHYLKSENIPIERTLFIPSQGTPEGSQALADHLRIEPASMIDVQQFKKELHTSALLFGYEQALARPLNQDYDQIVFATAGAGLTSACGVYRFSS
jgi:3-oxoacyl-[acyl-carrier-protein] synthase-3